MYIYVTEVQLRTCLWRDYKENSLALFKPLISPHSKVSSFNMLPYEKLYQYRV